MTVLDRQSTFDHANSLTLGLFLKVASTTLGGAAGGPTAAGSSVPNQTAENIARFLYGLTGPGSATSIQQIYDVIASHANYWFDTAPGLPPMPVDPGRQATALHATEWLLHTARLITGDSGYRDHVLHTIAVHELITRILCLFPHLNGRLLDACKGLAAGFVPAAVLTADDLVETLKRSVLLHDLGYGFKHARLVACTAVEWYGRAWKPTHFDGDPRLAPPRPKSCHTCRCRLGRFRRPAVFPAEQHSLPTAVQICQVCTWRKAKGTLSDKEHAIWRLTCESIYEHDPVPAGTHLDFNTSPIAFLLVLADALQQYARPALDLKQVGRGGIACIPCHTLEISDLPSPPGSGIAQMRAVLRYTAHDDPGSTEAGEYENGIADRVGKTAMDLSRLWFLDAAGSAVQVFPATPAPTPQPPSATEPDHLVVFEPILVPGTLLSPPP